MITRRSFIKQAARLGGLIAIAPGGVLPAALGRTRDREPAYLDLERRNELRHRVAAADALLDHCEICPRRCGVNRNAGETGLCRATARPVVYSAHPHFGEERSLSGRRGSGTVFFSNCNLRCVFCQNWPIAHLGYGKEMSDTELADTMLHLQAVGCHNINLVTPTHVMPSILKATRIATRKGLRLPLVYNTSGYERAEIVKLLDGIVDIYLPDMKFMDASAADTYCAGAADYPQAAQAAILEMHRQVGEHRVNPRGVAVRGLMIRHLVMPNRVAGTHDFVRWVARQLPKTTYVNIMSQYHVAYKAFEYPQIWRQIKIAEYLEAMNWARQNGLTNLDPTSLKVERLYQRRR